MILCTTMSRSLSATLRCLTFQSCAIPYIDFRKTCDGCRSEARYPVDLQGDFLRRVWASIHSIESYANEWRKWPSQTGYIRASIELCSFCRQIQFIWNKFYLRLCSKRFLNWVRVVLDASLRVYDKKCVYHKNIGSKNKKYCQNVAPKVNNRWMTP